MLVYFSQLSSTTVDGNIQLDAALITGLEAMFSRRRDYLLALAIRFGFVASTATRDNQDAASEESSLQEEIIM